MTEIQEVWMPMHGHDGYYVSNLGNMRRDARRVNSHHGSTRVLPATKIKGFDAKRTGYRQVMLSRKKVSVHRIVALAFCEKPDGCDVVNHLDGNRKNNIASNLEWTTISGNCLHAFRELGRVSPNKGRHGSKNKLSKPVIATSLDTGEEKFYESATEAAKHGFDSGSISNACRGIQKTHKGFTWRFKDQ